MENAFEFILRHFALLMIPLTIFLGASWWWKGRKARREDPELEKSYKRMIQWFVAAGSVPWLFLAAAVYSGEIKHVLGAIDFMHAGPWTLAFYAIVIGLGLAANYYIFFKGGAEELARHPGLMQYDLPPLGWKAMGLLIFVAHSGFFIFAYLMRDQLPHF